MNPMTRSVLIVAVLAAVSVAGWIGGRQLGVDPGRLPKTRLEVGQSLVVAENESSALAATAPSILRDALFARHNGIDIQARLDAGTVFIAPPGTAVRVLREDLDLALVSTDAPALPASFWITIDALVAAP